MRKTAGLIRCSKAFAVAVTLLLTSGVALAQDALAGAPPLSIQPGTYFTVRMNEAVSSNRNQVGDVFSATLTQPVIVQGIVVAHRGQTVGGRVIESNRAGKVSGTSRLGIALTSLTLADGQNVPMQTQLLVRNGRAATERDAGAVIGTTAAGAAIGAIAGRGTGAAIGAGVGAAAGVFGVLLTRGYPTIVYPESLLTFELLAPVAIDTSVAPHAFRAVNSEDYQQQAQLQPPPPRLLDPEYPPPVIVPPVIYPYPYPYYVYGPPYPYYYRHYARPYYYGPSVSFVFRGPTHYRYRAYDGYRPHPRPIYRSGPHRDGFGGRHRR